MITDIDVTIKIDAPCIKAMNINRTQESLTYQLLTFKSLFSQYAANLTFVDTLGLPVTDGNSATWTINVHRVFTTAEQTATSLVDLADSFYSDVDCYFDHNCSVMDRNYQTSVVCVTKRRNTFETPEEENQYDREKRNG